MRLSRSLLALALVALLAGWSVAADKPKIDRTITKEPVYKTTPKYALLFVGKEGKTRMWIVRDYDTLYVDRNGNGDLTDDKPLKPSAEDGGVATFRIDTLRDPHSKQKHTNFEVRIFLGSKKRKIMEHWSILLDIDGRYQEVAHVEPKEMPEQAPVPHLGKPLRMVVSDLTFTSGEETEIRAHVRCWTPGSVPTAVMHAKGFPADLHPVAEITFPGKTPDAKLIVLKVPLTQRC